MTACLQRPLEGLYAVFELLLDCLAPVQRHRVRTGAHLGHQQQQMVCSLGYQRYQ